VRLLCVLNGGVDHPSSRLRILQHLDHLKGHGIAADVFVAKGTRAVDLADLARRARRSDAVLVQKKLFSRWKLPLLLGSAPLLFDLDDAVFAVSPDESERFGDERAGARALSRRKRLAAVLRRSRSVIAGNRFLADYASRFARHVAILPTGVDLRPFPDDAVRRARQARRAAVGAARIGWVGSRPSLRYLGLLEEPLRRLCERRPLARWSLEKEAVALLSLDIGVMPLDDSPFSQGKCGLKILMYQAAGLPVVCSPVGVNRDLVEDGQTGFFAVTADDWVDRLHRLLDDPSLAVALGERGRARVLERYEAGAIGSRLADLVAGVVGSQEPRCGSGTGT